MRINTNVSALTAQEANTNTNLNIGSSLEKLSTGLKINAAADDGSGLAIADKLRTQASSLTQSVENGNSAVALIQIADKAMSETSNILDVIKQKLLQAGTATTSSQGQAAIMKDIGKLVDQIDNIASQTNYNGLTLLEGATSAAATDDKVFQMGETSSDTITMSANVQANSAGLSIETADLDFNTGTPATAVLASTAASNARGDLATIDTAINTLNGWRADYGSTQNQVESSVRNMSTAITNIQAAESVIRDVDYAEESANYNKQNIISQAGTYAMSQANSSAQNVLRLLQ